MDDRFPLPIRLHCCCCGELLEQQLTYWQRLAGGEMKIFTPAPCPLCEVELAREEWTRE
jgi:hypothetical protein